MKPIETLGRWALRVTIAYIAVNVMFAAVAIYTIQFVGKYNDGGFSGLSDGVWLEAATRFDNITLYSLIIYLVVMLVGFIVNGVWIYRASYNAGQLLPDPARIGPGWSVGWYFVPVFCLWKPFTAMKEIWNSSVAAKAELHEAAPGFFGVWWGCWLVGSAIGQISGRMYDDAAFEDYGNIAWMDLATSVLTIVSALYFYKIVKEVTSTQSNSSSSRIAEVFE